jgi:hypothetical protein
MRDISLVFLQFTRQIVPMASLGVGWGPRTDGFPSDCLQHKGFAVPESSLSVERELPVGADAKLCSGEIDAGVFKHNHVDAAVEF